VGYLAFYWARELPLFHWKGMAGRLRLLVMPLILLPVFQLSSDALLVNYRAAPTHGREALDALSSAYLIICVLVALCEALVVALVSHLIFLDKKVWRWGTALLGAAAYFILDVVSMALPGASPFLSVHCLLGSLSGAHLGISSAHLQMWVRVSWLFCSTRCLGGWRCVAGR
jgi:hypothetical protein